MTSQVLPAAGESELRAIVLGTPWLLRALESVRGLGLEAACIGAGALRDAVWDALHGNAEGRLPRDVDVAHFDLGDLSRDADERLERALRESEPTLPWEVTNQAGVHLWFERRFGHPVRAFTCLEEAVASWPETATAVAVSLDGAGELQVLAPLGLADLLGMVLRRNPARVSPEEYRRRLATKHDARRWPRVEIVSD